MVIQKAVMVYVLKRGATLQVLLAVIFTAIKVSGMSMFYTRYYVSLSTGRNVFLYGVNFSLSVFMSLGCKETKNRVR